MKTGQSLNVVASGTGKSIFWNKNMNERINELRLDAGISQLKDDLRLAVIDREGNIIDPLIGLEKFAELIVKKCVKSALSLRDTAIDNQWNLDETFHVIVDTIVEDLNMQHIFRS
jgi:hypothetical protein